MLVFGLSLGSFYGLVTLGFVIFFKSTGVINFAHGAIVLIAGHLLFVAAVGGLHAAFSLAFLIALLAVALLATGSRLCREFLGRHQIDDYAWALYYLGSVSGSFFGVDQASIGVPLTGQLVIDGVHIDHIRIPAIFESIVCIAALAIFFNRTRLGLSMRIVATDPEVSMVLGINVRLVHAVAWAIAGILGLVAVTFLGSQPGYGLQPATAYVAFRAFPAAVLGDMASLPGVVVGGLLIALVEVPMAGYQPKPLPWARQGLLYRQWLHYDDRNIIDMAGGNFRGDQRRVLVTATHLPLFGWLLGAASGIGTSATDILANAGAKVTACDRDKDRLTAIERNQGNSGKVLPIYADIAEQRDVQEAGKTCCAQFSRIDAVLHFAAILDRHNIDGLTPEIWDSVMRVNLRGTFLVVQAVLGHMRAQGGGRIVLTASDSARMRSLVSGPIYAASKGGVIALTHILALYLSPSKIIVNAVCQGFTITGTSKGWAPELNSNVSKRTPLGRLGQPDEIARVAVFLASDSADFITGEVVEVNGGIHFD